MKVGWGLTSFKTRTALACAYDVLHHHITLSDHVSLFRSRSHNLFVGLSVLSAAISFSRLPNIAVNRLALNLQTSLLMPVDNSAVSSESRDSHGTHANWAVRMDTTFEDAADLESPGGSGEMEAGSTIVF